MSKLPHLCLDGVLTRSGLSRGSEDTHSCLPGLPDFFGPLIAFFFQPRALESLYAGLPDATFCDAQLLVNWVRSVKSEAELKYMREAAVLTELGMQAGFDAIEVARA